MKYQKLSLGIVVFVLLVTVTGPFTASAQDGDPQQVESPEACAFWAERLTHSDYVPIISWVAVELGEYAVDFFNQYDGGGIEWNAIIFDEWGLPIKMRSYTFAAWAIEGDLLLIPLMDDYEGMPEVLKDYKLRFPEYFARVSAPEFYTINPNEPVADFEFREVTLACTHVG